MTKNKKYTEFPATSSIESKKTQSIPQLKKEKAKAKKTRKPRKTKKKKTSSGFDNNQF